MTSGRSTSSARTRLAVEVDGGYHSLSYFQTRDRHRDHDNARHGVLTLRFTNSDVLWRRRQVLREIDAAVEARSGVGVRRGWAVTRRAAQMREDYERQDEMRAVRSRHIRYERPLERVGQDPGKLLADGVQKPGWASQRDCARPDDEPRHDQ